MRFRLTELTADVAGSVPSSDSDRVLAFNGDGEKSDFEYVGPGVALDLSVNAALDGAGSGGSTDESYGSFFDPSGAVATPDAYPWRAEGSNSLVADITIANTSSSKNLKLDGLYFDIRRATSAAVRQVRLDYIAGELTLSVEPVTNVTDVFQSSLVFVEEADFYDVPAAGGVLESMSLNVAGLRGVRNLSLQRENVHHRHPGAEPGTDGQPGFPRLCDRDGRIWRLDHRVWPCSR